MEVPIILPEASVSNDGGVLWSDGQADVHYVAVVVLRKGRDLGDHLQAQTGTLTPGGPTGTRLALLLSRRGHRSWVPGRMKNI